MSDAELICALMEKKPTIRSIFSNHSLRGWWRWGGRRNRGDEGIRPRDLTLDALHDVEARLTDDQVCGYIGALTRLVREGRNDDIPASLWEWHATAEQKIKALATVLREGEKTNG